MRIGSFFMILLAALVALGYLFSDSVHLREDISGLQKQIERLSQSVQQAEQEKQSVLVALQNTEQEKQNALIALQNTGQELQSCRQQVEQSNKTIADLTNENTSLHNQLQVLADLQQPSDTSHANPPSETEIVQSSTFGLITFIILGSGSIALMALKALQKQPIPKKHTAKTGQFVYLTDAEIKELIQRRRDATKSKNR